MLNNKGWRNLWSASPYSPQQPSAIANRQVKTEDPTTPVHNNNNNNKMPRPNFNTPPSPVLSVVTQAPALVPAAAAVAPATTTRRSKTKQANAQISSEVNDNNTVLKLHPDYYTKK